jgi:hypothetical protein
MIVYNTENQRVCGLCPLSEIPSSGEERKADTLLGPLERTNLSHSD